MNIFTQFFTRNSRNNDLRQQEIIRDLLRREAKVGGQMFGKLPKGSDRQFFQLEKNTWVWVEQWIQDGKKMSKTTKYIIKPTELIKSVNGGQYERTSLQEAKNFEQAVHVYVNRVNKEVYGKAKLAL